LCKDEIKRVIQIYNNIDDNNDYNDDNIKENTDLTNLMIIIKVINIFLENCDIIFI
jgi:hypothetical protein